MKKLIFSLFLVLLLSGAPSSVQGGGGGGFAPPIIVVDLSGHEPLPPGIPAQAQWGGGGAGGANDRPMPNYPFFEQSVTVFTPLGICYPQCTDPIAVRETFRVCGFRTEPRSTLIEPDETHVPVAPLRRIFASDAGYYRTGTADPNVLLCLDYAPPSGYGTLLGDYQLLIEGSEGSVRKDFRVVYPDLPTVASMPWGSPVSGFTIDTVYVLMGFQPNQVVHLLFYVEVPNLVSDADLAEFVAERSAQVDSRGAVLIAPHIAKSADFTARDVLMLVTLSENGDDSPRAILDKYVTGINAHDYQTAYNLFLYPPDSYQSFVNGYSDTARIAGYLGPFVWQMETAAGLGVIVTGQGIFGRVRVVLVGYRYDGSVESYHGCYYFRLAKDGWKIQDASFKSLFLREPTDTEIRKLTSQPCPDYRPNL